MEQDVAGEFAVFLSERLDELHGHLHDWIRARLGGDLYLSACHESVAARALPSILVARAHGQQVLLHAGPACDVQTLDTSQPPSPSPPSPPGAHDRSSHQVLLHGPADGVQTLDTAQPPSSPPGADDRREAQAHLAAHVDARGASETSAASRPSKVDAEGAKERWVNTRQSIVENRASCRRSSRGGGIAAIAKILADENEKPTPFGATGCFHMARNLIYESASAVMVLVNAIIVGVSVDWSPGWSGWTLLDVFFALYFTIELLFNMYRLGARNYFLGDNARCRIIFDLDLRWRYFELLLVVSAILELILEALRTSDSDQFGSQFNILRIIRLARVARIIRVCRLAFFTELVMMVNGAVGGLRTFFASFALIALPLYITALVMYESIGKTGVQDAGVEAFSSLSSAWFTMFRCFVANECTDENGSPMFLLIVNRFGWLYALIYMLSTVLLGVCIFNVIAAIFVENTLAAAKSNHALQKRQRLQDKRFFAIKAAKLIRFVWNLHSQTPDTVRNVLEDEANGLWDGEFSMTQEAIEEAACLQITPDFFDFLCSFQDFKALLEDLDIADDDHMDLFDTLDIDGGGTIDLEEMIVGIWKLRGDARRSDIVSVGLIVRSIQADLKHIKKSVGVPGDSD